MPNVKGLYRLVATVFAVLLGAAPPIVMGQVTKRVSVTSAGEQGNKDSVFPRLSADGRFVTFAAYASNLVDGDTNNSVDVFVHDLFTQQTTRVSINSDGIEGNNWSNFPDISDDGRYVTYASFADNLVDGDTNARSDVFVHDRATGQTTRVSVSSSGQQGDGHSGHPRISGDGRFVVFESEAGNLVSDDSNHTWDVFVHDRLTQSTSRMSVSSTGQEADGPSRKPVISADGRYVAFESDATNLVDEDTNDRTDVFVHDRVTQQTRRVSVSSTGDQADRRSFLPAISGNGAIITFTSHAANLVPDDTNECADIFIHDTQTGHTTLASISSGGEQGNQCSYTSDISHDGRYVVFDSDATNLVDGDTNDRTDVFVHDRLVNRTVRASLGETHQQANDMCSFPAISGDGRYVAFDSFADNLTIGDTNDVVDVFVHYFRCAPMDFDKDGDVDQDDFELFQSCATGPGIPVSVECRNKDLDHDGDVDQDDYALFQSCFGGSNRPPAGF